MQTPFWFGEESGGQFDVGLGATKIQVVPTLVKPSLHTQFFVAESNC